MVIKKYSEESCFIDRLDLHLDCVFNQIIFIFNLSKQKYLIAKTKILNLIIADFSPF